MKEITFPTMIFIIVKILETKLYTCGLIDTGSEITIFKSFLLPFFVIYYHSCFSPFYFAMFSNHKGRTTMWTFTFPY